MSGDVTHGEGYEEQHVHEVYEQIASHFSSTRYKVWRQQMDATASQTHLRSHGPLLNAS